MCPGVFLNVPNIAAARKRLKVVEKYCDTLTEILPKDTVDTSIKNMVPYSGVDMPVSESRATAASTQFRVQYPNSRPRHIKIIGLGEEGGRIAQVIGRRDLAHVDIIANGDDVKNHAEAVVQGITGDVRGLLHQLQDANIIFMIAVSGEQIEYARVVSRVARELGKLVTAVMIEPPDVTAAQSAATLDILRACADMLVIGSDESYLDEMLNELGATAT